MALVTVQRSPSVSSSPQSSVSIFLFPSMRTRVTACRGHAGLANRASMLSMQRYQAFCRAWLLHRRPREWHARGLIRLDSARLLGADRPLYLIWGRIDSRARERESTERGRQRENLKFSLRYSGSRDDATRRGRRRGKRAETKNVSVINKQT